MLLLSPINMKSAVCFVDRNIGWEANSRIVPTQFHIYDQQRPNFYLLKYCGALRFANTPYWLD